jgi:hypothetical protein
MRYSSRPLIFARVFGHFGRRLLRFAGTGVGERVGGARFLGRLV